VTGDSNTTSRDIDIKACSTKVLHLWQAASSATKTTDKYCTHFTLLERHLPERMLQKQNGSIVTTGISGPYSFRQFDRKIVVDV
jgi:hypothetical protein